MPPNVTRTADPSRWIDHLRATKWIEHERAILIIIVALGLAIRLYGITLPFLDSHAEREAQVAMVARNLYRDRMNILCTRLDIFGNGSGCAVFEFPIVHALAALLYYAFGEHEIIGRLVSVAFSVAAMFVMYGLARRFLPPLPALAALGLYTFSPMNIYFSRAFMPESSLMFFSVAAVYFLLKWVERPTPVLYSVSVASAALAYLAKPTAVLLLAPIFSAWFLKYRWHVLRRADFWLYLFLTLTPIALWAVYANHINAQNLDMPVVFGRSWVVIVTERGGIFNWWIDPVFYVNMGRSIVLLLLTPVGFIGAVAGGLMVPTGRWRPVLYAWLAAVIAYFYALAGANQGHVYYQLPLLPIAAILFGFAVARFMNSQTVRELWGRKPVRYMVLVGVLLTVVGYGAAYGWLFSYMYDTTLRMPYVPEVSQIIREQTPQDGSLVLNQPHASSTVLTYYAQRKSWSFSVAVGEQAIEELEYLRARGATTYVAIDTRYGSGIAETRGNDIFWHYLNDTYTPITLSEHYVIFDLRASELEPSSYRGR